METQNPPNLFERFNQWITESIMIKLFSIGFLTLILLIPASWIEQLIQERQGRAHEVMREVSEKWSGHQTLTGPVLMIPFTKIETVKRWSDGQPVEELIKSQHRAFFLPDSYQVQTKINPEVLHRGLFDVAVYKSKLNLQANFSTPDFSSWGIPDHQVHWKEAVILQGISDLRGINDHPVVEVGTKELGSEPINDTGLMIASPNSNSSPNEPGMITPLGWTTRVDETAVSISVSLKGSESLHFIPIGKTTSITAEGAWPSPSFEGKLLPETRTLSDSGFTATWKVLSFNRPFSQKWIDQAQPLSGSEFGVRLTIPADQYQKSTRTAKYGILIILLTFTALFLVEITTQTRIHPFQYILIGVALIIYYTLLLSFSEQMGYNAAYAVASTASTLLVTLYATTFLKSKPVVLLFSLLMAFFYAFIFIIIQAEDFSLLIGSLGLFTIIGLLMYFSRNINWYGART